MRQVWNLTVGDAELLFEVHQLVDERVVGRRGRVPGVGFSLQEKGSVFVDLRNTGNLRIGPLSPGPENWWIHGWLGAAAECLFPGVRRLNP